MTITVFHHRHCNSSTNGLALVEDSGQDYEVVNFHLVAERPSRETLESIVAKLDGPVEELVRKDALFQKLGLKPGDYVTPSAVVDLLVQQPKLMQRPVVVTADRAVIGRPKERIAELLGS